MTPGAAPRRAARRRHALRRSCATSTRVVRLVLLNALLCALVLLVLAWARYRPRSCSCSSRRPPRAGLMHSRSRRPDRDADVAEAREALRPALAARACARRFVAAAVGSRARLPVLRRPGRSVAARGPRALPGRLLRALPAVLWPLAVDEPNDRSGTRSRRGVRARRAAGRGARARRSPCSPSTSPGRPGVLPFLTLTHRVLRLAAAHFALPPGPTGGLTMAEVTYEHVWKRFDGTVAVSDFSLDDRGRRVHGSRRSLGLRQEHGAAHARRARDARRAGS